MEIFDHTCEQKTEENSSKIYFHPINKILSLFCTDKPDLDQSLITL